MKKIYLLSLLSIFSLNLLCQVQWTKHSENPVMVPGTSGEWDKTLDYIGSIILHDDTYMMWYSGITDSGIESVGLATSPDGTTWTRDANNPVFEKGPEGSWDQDYVSCGDVTLVDDTFHMWYTGHRGVWDNIGIGHAFSTDGINWERDTNNPVLTVEPEGTWEYLWIWIDEVVFDGNIFHMWYEGGSEPGKEVAIGHATSPDGVVWTRDPSNPVLEPGASEDWDYPCVAFPGVVFDGTNFHMWYCGGTNVGHNYDIGYATSTDGSDWTKYDGNPVMERGPDDWDAGSVFTPNVIDSAGIKYKMWYNGKSKSAGWNVKFGYAESYESCMETDEINGHRNEGAPASTVIDSMIYVFGGIDKNLATLSSAQAYNTNNKRMVRSGNHAGRFIWL